MAGQDGYKVLVKEKIADAGVALLREHFDVDVLTDMSDDELRDGIAGYEGIVIRSGTKLTADLLDLSKLDAEMKQAAANLDFERAARLRDEIRSLRVADLGLAVAPVER